MTTVYDGSAAGYTHGTPRRRGRRPVLETARDQRVIVRVTADERARYELLQRNRGDGDLSETVRGVLDSACAMGGIKP